MADVLNYVYPVTAGATTPPTAAQMRTHQQMYVTITGDTAATSVVITHNWGLSTAEIVQWPEVEFEPLLAGFYGANPLITTRAANSVTITHVAFAAVAAVGVRLKRPWSATR
jgi:hypothetical protein